MATIYVPKGTTDLSGLGVANTDTVRFIEGNQTVTAGLTSWNAFAAGLVSLEFGPQFTGTIGGGSAGNLDVDVDSGVGTLIYAAGGGSLYWGAASRTITRCKQLGQGNLYLSGGGTVTTLELGKMAKYVSVGDAVIVTNLRQSTGSLFAQFPTGGNGNGFRAITIDGGVSNLERFFDSDFGLCTADISGNASVVVKRADTSATRPTGSSTDGGADATQGVIRLSGNASLTWWGGNIDNIEVIGDARLDLSNAPAGITIDNLKITAKAMKNSILKSRHGTITITSSTVWGGDTDDITA